MNDFYDLLGLSRKAEDDTVAKAYRRYALAYNPLCSKENSGSTSGNLTPEQQAEKFKLISQAYVVLSNPKARAIYDLYGEEGVRHGGTGNQGIPGGLDLDNVDPQRVFTRFFGVDNPFQILGDIDGVKGNQHDFFSNVAAQQKVFVKCPPIEVTLPITLEDVFFGATRRAVWQAVLPQPTSAVAPAAADQDCSQQRLQGALGGFATLSVEEHFDLTVPKGAKSGDRYVVAGKGNGAPKMARGDVFIVFQLQPHDRFRREGDDLVVKVPITLSEALCGTTVKVRTMEDRELCVLIDEIVHPKYRSRVAGEGLPRGATASGLRGDLIVECDTKFPSFLTLEQKSELQRILNAS